MKKLALIFVPALLVVTIGAFALTAPMAPELAPVLSTEAAPTAGIVFDPCLEACADELNFCMSRCGFGCEGCWDQFHVCQAACK